MTSDIFALIEGICLFLSSSLTFSFWKEPIAVTFGCLSLVWSSYKSSMIWSNFACVKAAWNDLLLPQVLLSFFCFFFLVSNQSAFPSIMHFTSSICSSFIFTSEMRLSYISSMFQVCLWFRSLRKYPLLFTKILRESYLQISINLTFNIIKCLLSCKMCT